MTDLAHRGDACLRAGTAVGHPATSVTLAADLAAILDPGTPAFQHLPRLSEEIR